MGTDRFEEPRSTGKALSRRHFVRGAGALALGSLGATLLSACGATSAPTPTSGAAALQSTGAGSRQLPRRPIRQTGDECRDFDWTCADRCSRPDWCGADWSAARGQEGQHHQHPAMESLRTWYDDWLGQFGTDWGSKNGVTVKIDHVSTNDLPARIAAEASAGAGHDIIEFNGQIQTRTYADKLVDVGDVADAVSKKYGGWIDMAKNVGTVDGQWKALLDYFIAQPNIYRKDYFDEVGASPPDDYMSLLDASRKMKANGHPCGQAMSNCNDANHNWRSVLYSFGATETTPDGSTITLNSPETLAALKYGVQLYNDAMTDEVFSWDNSGNNLLILSGRGAWIDNATSVYITARDQNPDIAENLYIALNPKGPGDKGARKNVSDPNAWAIWKSSQNADTAKAFLASWYDAWQDWGKISSGYNSPPLNDMWKKPMPGLDQDSKLTIMQDWKDLAYVYGYQGPITGAMEEVQSTFVIPNMFARATRGDTPENALAWAEGEYKSIFAKYKLGS